MRIKTVKDLRDFIKDLPDDTRVFYSPNDYGSGNYDNDLFTVKEYFNGYNKEYASKFLKEFKTMWRAKDTDLLLKLYW